MDTRNPKFRMGTLRDPFEVEYDLAELGIVYCKNRLRPQILEHEIWIGEIAIQHIRVPIQKRQVW
jgi:hypothetical protein